MTDMQHGQELEGDQDLPLCVDPSSGKEFMDASGYVSPCGPLSFLLSQASDKQGFS